MDDPTLSELAHKNMGHVKEKVTGYTSKPSTSPRKARSNATMTNKIQNGSSNGELVSATGPRLRALDRKNKFRRSEPPSMHPQLLQNLDSIAKTGPTPTSIVRTGPSPVTTPDIPNTRPTPGTVTNISTIGPVPVTVPGIANTGPTAIKKPDIVNTRSTRVTMPSVPSTGSAGVTVPNKTKQFSDEAIQLPDEATQEQNLRKAVCATYEQKFETVTEMSYNETELQISSNNSNLRYSLLSKSPSPANLDSSFDETSDEDVITDRVMGKDAEPEEEETSSPLPIKPERRKKGTRGRSTVLVKTDAPSLSPVEHRKNIQALSDSFKPSSLSSSGSTSSVLRSQTFTERSPRVNKRMERPPGSPLTTRCSGTSDDSPRSATQLPGGFVYLECEEAYRKMRAASDVTLQIVSCNDLPRTISSLPSDKRHHILQEIYSSEWTYVNGLEIVVEVFKKPLRSVLNATEVDSIFANVEDLLLCNLHLLSALHDRLIQWNEESTIGDIFVTNFTQQHKTMYGVYCNNYDKAEHLLLKLLKRRKDFENAVNNCLSNPRVMKGLRVDSFLITPVQRIPKYKLLIGDLLKQTPTEHEDHGFLEGALSILTELAEYMNAQRLEVETVKKVRELQKKMVEILVLLPIT